MNDFNIHWSESLTWAKCSVTQGFKANPHSPVLHSTLWSSPEQSLCQPWFANRDLQHQQNCSLLCVHAGAWWVGDNTTHCWKSFLLVAFKAFSPVTSAIMNASHGKHIEARKWNPIPAQWLLPDEAWTWDCSLNWISWSWTVVPRSHSCVYGSWHMHCQQALLILTK